MRSDMRVYAYRPWSEALYTALCGKAHMGARYMRLPEKAHMATSCGDFLQKRPDMRHMRR